MRVRTLKSHGFLSGILLPMSALACASGLLTAGCSSGGGSSSGGLSSSPSPAAVSVTRTIDSSGGQITLSPSGANGSYTLNFLANAVSAATSMTMTSVPQNSLPASLRSVKIGKQASTRFQPNTNNIYVFAFTLKSGGITAFNLPVTVSATSVPSLAAGTVLNLAVLQSGTWQDIQTLVVGANGTLTEQQITTQLEGLRAPGTYLIYEPAPGTSTAYSNYGVALIADDGNAATTNGIQVVNLYDANGNILATPGLKTLDYSGAADLDGEALTPDGSQGILVDGGNTVRFFSGVQTGTPVASTSTLDISNYGGDGDSVAIMPTGDTAVVSGDSASQLLVVSGIVSGKPTPATTITTPSSRDGVVISNDGKTLLARGPSGLTVYAIAPITPVTGNLGGQSSYSFTQTMDMSTLGSYNEDGRDGVAISPADSSHAVVVGDTNAETSINLITGLPNAPVIRSLHLRIPPPSAKVRSIPKTKEQKEKDYRAALIPAGVSNLYSVSITPDGKYAVVGTDSGLVLVSGVDTGTLAQVGSLYNPMVTVGTGANAETVPLGIVTTLGITLDGANVVAMTPQPDYTNGTLFVIPITSSGFGAPIAQLNGIAVPNNDQLVIH